MAPKKPTPPATAVKQLNIRVTDNVAQAFRAFCEDNRCTQSDGLAYLLSSQIPDHITSLSDRLTYYRDYVRYLQGEFDGYKRKCIEQQQTEREVRRTLINYASAIVRTMQANCGTPPPHPEAIAPSSYRRTKRQKNLRQYSYPAQAGCTLFALSNIAYGDRKNYYEISMRPIFFFGETASGKVKYRWYPKQDYIGIPLHNQAYALRNSQWIVAHKISNDGAADLIAGVPLALFERDTSVEAKQKAHTHNLDDRIHAAESKIGQS